MGKGDRILNSFIELRTLIIFTILITFSCNNTFLVFYLWLGQEFIISYSNLKNIAITLGQSVLKF